MAQLHDLMVANPNGGFVRDVPMAERMTMLSLEVIRHAMQLHLAVNNWERAARWAVELAPYENRKLAPIAPAAVEDDEDDCRAN
jgi:hypothetical protein